MLLTPDSERSPGRWPRRLPSPTVLAAAMLTLGAASLAMPVVGLLALACS
jgi:hypothetical protein